MHHCSEVVLYKLLAGLIAIQMIVKHKPSSGAREVLDSIIFPGTRQIYIGAF